MRTSNLLAPFTHKRLGRHEASLEFTPARRLTSVTLRLAGAERKGSAVADEKEKAKPETQIEHEFNEPCHRGSGHSGRVVGSFGIPIERSNNVGQSRRTPSNSGGGRQGGTLR